MSLTGYVDKRCGRVAVAGIVVSQAREIRLGFQINRLDEERSVVLVWKTVPAAQPLEARHLRSSGIQNEASNG